MREISFRGKSLRSGIWVYGDLVHIHTKDGEAIGIKDTPYHVNDGFCNIIPTQVDPETVGQFIGRHDNRGWKIYEGDIVRHYNGEQPVEWDSDSVSFQMNLNSNVLDQEVCYPDDIEVIGNIYEQSFATISPLNTSEKPQ